MRLAKYLAKAGIASRRKAEELIAAGRVEVNSEVITLPQTLVSETDQIKVDGKNVRGAENKVYYLLNKPAGYISTVRDTHNRPKITDLLNAAPARVYPVGRLDADTTGVLLLTNDGELAFRLTHPRYRVKKVYRAWVCGLPDSRTIKNMSDGMIIEGEKTAPAKVKLLKTELKKRSALLEITLTEGKKRQVKKMCSASGHPVTKLHRESFAGLKADRLPVGSYRLLKGNEISMLYRIVGL
ncbi:MAG: pseudouridine synthase [Dethiobacteria bacterium]